MEDCCITRRELVNALLWMVVQHCSVKENDDGSYECLCGFLGANERANELLAKLGYADVYGAEGFTLKLQKDDQ